MEVINLLDITTREELYQWYKEHHDKEQVCWVKTNRAEKTMPGVISYVDAVEVALCFGWIDSTQKRGEDGRPIQRFTPRRKKGIWCEQNVERCRRLIKLGEMTPAGEAVLPDMNPEHFVFYDWVIDALKADKQAWTIRPSLMPTSESRSGAYSTMPTQSEWKKHRKHSASSLKTLTTERCNVDGAMAAN